MTDTVKLPPSTEEEVVRLRHQLDRMQQELQFLELKLLAVEDLFIGYLQNERAALMSVAKFAESRLTKGTTVSKEN